MLLYTRKVDCIGECCNLIVNGDAQALVQRGWAASMGGILGWGWSINGTNAFKHGYRSRITSGIAQELNPACMQPGNKFEMRFIYKLLDANDQPYACENDEWGDLLSCPHIGIFYENNDGRTEWKRAHNAVAGNRTASYNLFQTSLTIPDDIKEMSVPKVFVYGLPAGVQVLMDDADAWVRSVLIFTIFCVSFFLYVY